MSFESRLGVPVPAARTAEGERPDARVEEAIESVEHYEITVHSAPARGILNAMAIGAGAWMIIFAAVALTRSIFFG